LLFFLLDEIENENFSSDPRGPASFFEFSITHQSNAMVVSILKMVKVNEPSRSDDIITKVPPSRRAGGYALRTIDAQDVRGVENAGLSWATTRFFFR
jgi:hypothetical protein